MIEAHDKVVLVAMPGDVLRRAHAFPDYAPEQVLAVDRPGGLDEGAAIAASLAEPAGADVPCPDPPGAIFI